MKQKTICIIVMALAVCYSVGLILAHSSMLSHADNISDSVEMSHLEYADKIFDGSVVHTINIELPESKWEDLKAHALYKECYDSTVTIDGESYYHVGIRTKGNVTLIQNVVRAWDRYSLVVDFSAFNESQRYYGLDKLALNNCICDSSFMRDYLSYDMMRSMGIPTPLCSFTAVYLNGEYLGLYSAVESMSESFCIRNFGYDYGNLYKPEQMDIAGMLTGSERDCALRLSVLADEKDGVNAFDFLGVTDTTVALQYQGENFDLYSDIWDNAVFKIGRSDKQRLVDAIRTINSDDNADDVLYTDELLRYLAVSSFVLNDDCYFSYAGHNYGLYEKDGLLLMIPWDYDHSLGCMGAASGSASWTELLNLPIDEPLIGTTMEERPLVNALLRDESCLELYHQYLDEFLRSYVESGRLQEKAKQIHDLILPYVITDPTSGVDEARFEAAYASNLEFCRLRTQSLRGQLAGKIPATAEGQEAYPETLVDCSHFVSPDSGSLTELLLPEGSGLGFEDLIGRLEPQVNPVATVAIMPIDSILSALDGSSNGLMEKLVTSGKVHDEEALRSGIKRLIVHTGLQIMSLLLAPIVLILALIFVFRYGRNRYPSAKRRKRGRSHAV